MKINISIFFFIILINFNLFSQERFNSVDGQFKKGSIYLYEGVLDTALVYNHDALLKLNELVIGPEKEIREFKDYYDIANYHISKFNQYENWDQLNPEISKRFLYGYKSLAQIFAYLGYYLLSADMMELAISVAEIEIISQNLSYLDRITKVNNLKPLYDWYINSIYEGNDSSNGYREKIMAGLAISDRIKGQSLSTELLKTQALANDFIYITQRFSLKAGSDYLAHESESNLKSINYHEETILNYHLTDNGLFYWIYNHKLGLSFGKLPMSQNLLEQTIENLHEEIESSLDEFQDDLVFKLSDKIIPEEILRYLTSNNLVIIPHGAMNSIPFAMLNLPNSEKKLIDNFSIRVSPSINLLQNIETNINFNIVQEEIQDPLKDNLILDSIFKFKKIKNAEEKIEFLHKNPILLVDTILIVTNPEMPFFPRENKKDPLIKISQLEYPETSENIIKGLLNSASFKQNTLSTETEVLDFFPKASLIHITTHSEVFPNREKVFQSYIALSKDKNNDGLLQLDEILSDNLDNLDTELLVLSSCQSASGQIDIGEGVIGLQWALLIKGVKRVISSLWEINDEGTRVLMDKFYSHWATDADLPSISESLRRAQLDMKNSKKYKSSKYWAAFQLYGAK